jgi:hypothetical protein
MRDTAERSVRPAADRPAPPRLAAKSASGTCSRAAQWLDLYTHVENIIYYVDMVPSICIIYLFIYLF